MLAAMFPGQGSQHRGMGRDLFDQVPQFLSAEREIDEILGYSLRKLCLEDPQNRLNDTRFTQPALFTVNALHWYRWSDGGGRADFLLGLSLGEYNALLAAGVFDLITGIRIVQKRGEFMAQTSSGAMAAVLGVRAVDVMRLLERSGLDGIDVANFNAPTQVVISGPTDEIRRAEPVFRAAGASAYIRLPVSAAFHSRYMAAPAARFGQFLARCLAHQVE